MSAGAPFGFMPMPIPNADPDDARRLLRRGPFDPALMPPLVPVGDPNGLPGGLVEALGRAPGAIGPALPPPQGSGPVSAAPAERAPPAPVPPAPPAQMPDVTPMGDPTGLPGGPVAASAPAPAENPLVVRGIRPTAQDPMPAPRRTPQPLVPLPPKRPTGLGFEPPAAQADVPAPGAVPMQATPAPAAAEGPSFGDRLGAGLTRLGESGVGDQMLAMAAGLLSAPGAAGFARGFEGMAKAERDRAVTDLAKAEMGLKLKTLGQQQRALTGNAQYVKDALAKRGQVISDDQALALGSNTAFMTELFKGNSGYDEGAKISAQIAARKKEAPGLGLVEGSPEYRSFVGTGKIGRDQDLSAADRKAIHAAEDQLPLIAETIDKLKRAKELNNKTFTGYSAGTRGWLGTSLPDGMVPDIIADPKGAEATREFGQIMRMESLKSLSETMKGATTEREMTEFLEILGDPTTPPEIRARTLDRMHTLALRQQQLAQRRADELRDGTYYKPRDPAAAAPAPQEAAPAPTPAQEPAPSTPAIDPLSSARAAIAAGADRRKVIQRLLQNGINPKGL